MKAQSLWFVFALLISCDSANKEYFEQIKNHRRETYKNFLRPGTPIMDGNTVFRGLSYFEINPEFKVIAQFEKNPQAAIVSLAQNGTSNYEVYGLVKFMLGNKALELTAFYNTTADHDLFIPFTDLTNGETTYEIGRYLDVKLPIDDKVILDFNLAYNPYCAYNDNYQCPIPPPENFLDIAIEAGEKKYEKVS